MIREGHHAEPYGNGPGATAGPLTLQSYAQRLDLTFFREKPPLRFRLLFLVIQKPMLNVQFIFWTGSTSS